LLIGFGLNRDYTPLSLPEGGPLNATMTSNAADPGSRNLTVVVHSPESYFHTLSIVSTGTLSFVAVNGQMIDPSNYYSFTYFLTGNDLSVTAPADWTITVGSYITLSSLSRDKESG
jgi:hypothetical protein